MRLAFQRTLSIACAFALSALAACGDDSAEPASSPTDFVAPDSPIVFEASLASDEQVANAEALIAKLGEVPLLGATLDPRDLIERAIDESAATEGVDVSFAEDIEPWIGDRAALALTSIDDLVAEESEAAEVIADSDEDPEEFMLAIEIKDEDAARAAIDRIIAADTEIGTEESEIGGQTVKRILGEEGGLALVDGFVVMSDTDAALEEAFAARDGESLGDRDEYREGFDDLPAERLASAYLDFGAFLEAAAGEAEADAEDLEAFRDLYGDSISRPFTLALSAGEQSLILDSSSGGFVPTFPSPSASDLLLSAPEDSLAAVGFDDVGGQLRTLYDVMTEIASATVEGEQDADELQSLIEGQLGVSVDDATAVFGDGVAYLRGDLPDDFSVGIETARLDDGDAPTQLLDALGRELESFWRVGPPLEPQASGLAAENPDPDEIGFVNVEVGDELIEVLVAPDRAAAKAAGDVGTTLADGDLPARAEALLGDEHDLVGFARPGAIADSLIEGGSVLDLFTSGASREQALVEFLAKRLDLMAFGLRESGDRAISRFALEIK